MEPIQIFHPYIAYVSILAWTTIVVGALGFMVKKWMSSIEEQLTRQDKLNRLDHKQLYQTLSNHGERLAAIEARIHIGGL